MDPNTLRANLHEAFLNSFLFWVNIQNLKIMQYLKALQITWNFCFWHVVRMGKLHPKEIGNDFDNF